MFGNLGASELLIVPLAAFWLWMFVEAAVKEPTCGEKIGWMAVVFFTSIFGALLYFLVRRPRRAARVESR